MDYLGVEVVSTSPVRFGPTGERQRLETTVLDAETGVRTLTTPARQPAKARSFDMFANRDYLRAWQLRQFLMARQGRLKPFWIPSWQSDLVLAAPSGSGVGTITINESGYSERVWPAGAARRHLALRSPSGVLLVRRVTAAVSNGDGTETLTLIGPAGEATLGVAVATDWLVMFLRYVRLDDDQPAFRSRGILAIGGYSVLQLPVVDLSVETPS